MRRKIRCPCTRYEWVLGTIAILCLTISILLFTTFSPIYEAIVKKELAFKMYDDGSLSYSGFMLANPPMHNIMNFYMYNVTNPDEIIYEGAKPRLLEIGPFAIQESEHKKYYRMNDNQTEMFYENYKMYNIREDLSCETCNWDGNLIFPNPTGVGATAAMWNPAFKITKVGHTIIAIGLTLMGEVPFVSHTVKEVLFTGYNDALLSAAHSQLIYDLSGYFKGNKSIIPIPIPSMPLFAYFQGYNNSKDEHYWIKTGKENIDELGKVVSWGNLKELPEDWWTTKEARAINGSDSGSFCKMHLDESSEIPMFQSFQCRSFTAKYAGQTDVAGIPSFTFSVLEDEYDTTLEKNKGFRYPNIEKRNYFSDWPSCPTKKNCAYPIDCSLKENLCCDTCNGSYVNGNYILPPGMFPLVCYPGKLEPTPFAVFYSPPHYLYSPPEVVSAVVGMNPDPSIHQPFVYNHEPYSGTVTEVFVRLQVNMPVMTSVDVPAYMHMPNKVIPLFWENAHATLLDSTYSKLRLGFVTVPLVVTIVEFSLLGIGLFLIAILIAIRVYKHRKSKHLQGNITQNGTILS